MASQESRQRNRRKRYILEPRLQFLFAFAFLSMAVLATVVQSFVFSTALASIANTLPEDGSILELSKPRLLLTGVLTNLALMAPMSLVIGILLTHRIVGPLYRFRVFLRETVAGNMPHDCRLRSGDELQDLCDLLNKATEPARLADPNSSPTASPSDASDPQAA